MLTLYNSNCFDLVDQLNNFDLMVLDPPFKDWHKINFKKPKNIIAFCNANSRHEVEKKLGKPKTELVWHFADGRWVSINLPRITHDYIYIYGKPKQANVGDYQKTQPQYKGTGSIGKLTTKNRVYNPKAQKQLNSVLIYPRNMSNKLGAWGKPYKLIKNLIDWFDPSSVIDPFMGSGVVLDVCKNKNIDCTGIEINKEYFDYVQDKLNTDKQQIELFEPSYQLEIK